MKKKKGGSTNENKIQSTCKAFDAALGTRVLFSVLSMAKATAYLQLRGTDAHLPNALIMLLKLDDALSRDHAK